MNDATMQMFRFLAEAMDREPVTQTALNFDRPQQIIADIAGMERLVLNVILARGERGATADEIALALNLPNTSTRPRCTGLNRRGLICDSGERRACGPHQRGIVWRAS